MDGVVREVNVRMLGKGLNLVNTVDREWKISQLLLRMIVLSWPNWRINCVSWWKNLDECVGGI